MNADLPCFPNHQHTIAPSATAFAFVRAYTHHHHPNPNATASSRLPLCLQNTYLAIELLSSFPVIFRWKLHPGTTNLDTVHTVTWSFFSRSSFYSVYWPQKQSESNHKTSIISDFKPRVWNCQRSHEPIQLHCGSRISWQRCSRRHESSHIIEHRPSWISVFGFVYLHCFCILEQMQHLDAYLQSINQSIQSYIALL